MGRDGPIVGLYSRNTYDWTARPGAIAAAAELIKTKSFTIDGGALCSGLMACHGSRSCLVGRPLEPRSSSPRRRLDHLIKRDGEDLRNLPLLDRKPPLSRLWPSASVTRPQVLGYVSTAAASV
jgi:ATP-dependent DNA ligase